MKLLKMVVFMLFVASLSFAQQEEKKLQLKTFEDSVSYSIGQNIGKNLKDPNMKINFEALSAGMKDLLNGTSILKDDEIQKVLMAFNQQMMAKRNADMGEMKVKNKKAADEFLAANKKKEGVVTLPDGLQYKILKTGTGPSPKDTNTVKVDYKGTTIDGKEFDSSYKRGQPAEFKLNQVIKGWTEALQLMHVGDKWELYIPPTLGYGENGAGEAIQPNAALIFEVELLDILK